MIPIFPHPAMRGKVAHIPGLFHVVTRFDCVSLIPFSPDASFLILEADRSRPIRIPLQRLSILMAYLRTGLILLASGCSFIGLMFPLYVRPYIGIETHAIMAGAGLLAAIAFLVLFWLTFPLNRHGPKSAERILRRLGLDEAVVDRYLAPPDLPDGNGRRNRMHEDDRERTTDSYRKSNGDHFSKDY